MERDGRADREAEEVDGRHNVWLVEGADIEIFGQMVWLN